MEVAISVAAVLVGVGLYWTGTKKLEAGSLATAILTAADLCLCVLGFVLLGWLGLVLAAAVTVIGLLVHSVRLAMQKESHLASAGARARTDKETMERLFDRLYESDKVFRQLGPVRTAHLIALLADRARSVDEIESMARPVALLWFINESPRSPASSRGEGAGRAAQPSGPFSACR